VVADNTLAPPVQGFPLMTAQAMAGRATDGLPGAPVQLPVSIVIPAYGAAAQLADCLDSIRLHAPGYHIVVADDATPGDSVAGVVRSFAAELPLDYVRRERNLGFVENCNDAVRSILPTGRDILLLNSDTKVTAGFLEEMWEVLHAHDTHGAVSPRSNNATIFSVPCYERLTPDASYDLWQSIRSLLPRYQVMPTAVGFCLLLRNAAVRRLGLFDPAYSPGYNEENDLICRFNRHGYSAVVAHQAFVFHFESASFGPDKQRLERRNRRILDGRCPEYLRKVTEHMRYGVHPIDHFASVWRPHRPAILIDLFHLQATHSRASEFALSLLLHLMPILEARADVRLGLSEAVKQFFAPELTGYRFYSAERHATVRFDLVFKPSQARSWGELNRMVKLGARLAFTYLDIANVRCDSRSTPETRILLREAAQLADQVIATSHFATTDFAAFYGTALPFTIIPLASHNDPPIGGDPKGHVLVLGHQCHHEAVHHVVSQLKDVGRVVALGEEPSEPQTRRVGSMPLSRSAMAQLFDSAAVAVCPSLNEGFSVPVVDAIARGLPVVALDTAANREVRASAAENSLVLVKDYDELRTAVAKILRERLSPIPMDRKHRRWPQVAQEYARAFDELLARDIDVGLIHRRWDLMMTLDAVYPFG
jgi:GT2 family glycosyltransferase